MTGGGDLRPPRLILLSAALVVLLAVLSPPEIHPESRIALALLVPLCLAAALRALPAVLDAARGAAPILAGAGVWLLFNAAAALQAEGAIAAIERLALAAAVFLLFEGIDADRGRRMRLTAGLLTAAGTAAALVALWQAANGFDSLAAGIRDSGATLGAGTQAAMLARLESGRVFGPLLLPASLAGLIAMTLPCTLAVARDLRAAGRGALLAGAVLQGVALAATASIGGIASLTLAAGVTGVAALKGTAARLRFAALVLCAGGLLAAGAAWSRGVARPPIASPAGGASPAATDDPAGLRRGNMSAALEMIAMYPVTGAGGGGYATLYPLLRREGMNESRHAHNSYLELTVEYGLAALPAIALFAVLCFGRWRRACSEGGAVAIAATGIPAFLLHNAADFTAYQPAVLVPFVALAAAIGLPRGPVRGPRKAAAVVAWSIGLAASVHAVSGGVADLLRERARGEAASGDLEGALAHSSAAERWSPLDPAVKAETAGLLIRAGRPGEAVPGAQAAASLDPMSAGRSLVLGRVLMAAGRPAEALVAFSRAERLYPMGTEARAERERLEGELDGGSR